MKTAMAVVALIWSVSAGAKPVYKCEEKGKITYTDQPCTPGAQAAKLPKLIVAVPPTQSEQDLARAYEARLEQERAQRDRDDAAWLKEHAERKEREEREAREARKAKAKGRRAR